MFRLDNKVAVVTGAGSGIGNAIANTFAGVGARVFVLEANLEAGKAAAEKIRAAGGQADAIACDVAKSRLGGGGIRGGRSRGASMRYSRQQCGHRPRGHGREHFRG